MTSFRPRLTATGWSLFVLRCLRPGIHTHRLNQRVSICLLLITRYRILPDSRVVRPPECHRVCLPATYTTWTAACMPLIPS